MKQSPIQRKRRSRLRLSIAAGSAKEMAGFLRQHLHAAHMLLGRQTAVTELSVALVDDREMSRLHEQFMGIAGPTDVLTFPLEFDSAGRPTSGEIIVNLAEAARQARALNNRQRMGVECAQFSGRPPHKEFGGADIPVCLGTKARLSAAAPPGRQECLPHRIHATIRLRRCRKNGHTLEVLLYALHGLLHLSGYDDRTRSGFAAMHRMEDCLLARLGVGAVFNPAASKARSRR